MDDDPDKNKVVPLRPNDLWMIECDRDWQRKQGSQSKPFTPLDGGLKAVSERRTENERQKT